MPSPEAMDRRDFLKTGAAVACAAVAGGAAATPLLKTTDLPSIESFLQLHYQELTPEQKEQIFKRIEGEVERQYHVKAKVNDPQPLPGVEFAYGLNLTICIGCRKCVYACVRENNQSRYRQIQYIRVLRIKKGSLDLAFADHHYQAKEVPEEGYYYMPVQCHQCANPPCVKVCPIKATWKEQDGIVVIDYNWCIGCRYCQTTCPYWSRQFNYTEPHVHNDEINPDMGYLSNIPRTKGVVEKCHFCLHRTRVGKFPACLEACPTGARKFGNMLDPNSEVSQIMKKHRVFILKEELGTVPRFFYYF